MNRSSHVSATRPARRVDLSRRPPLGKGPPLFATLALLAGAQLLQAQAVRESFSSDPVPSARFIQRVTGTESQFNFNAAAQNLTAVLDVDASPAHYLSSPFAPLTDGTDGSFSSRFRVESFDPTDHPTAFLGLLTDQHVGDFGDGLVLVLSVANGVLVGHADIESFDQTFSGSAIPLEVKMDYLVVGRYRAASRLFAVEIFSGPGFTNLIGFSTTSLPAGQTVSLSRVGLQNGGARDLDSTVGSLTLTVDDLFTPAIQPRTLTISDSTVTEGDNGPHQALFHVQLAPPSSLPITVNFVTADGSAQAGADYAAQSGTLTFPPGATLATIAVPILGDLLHEAAETFKVVLTGAVDATLVRDTGTGTILDNDPRPTLAISDTTGLEGQTTSTSFEFIVTLSSPSGQFVAVDFDTADGGATQGSDYTAQTGTLTFLPGETSHRIQVAVHGDLNQEPDETFFVNLSNPTNAGFSKAQGAGTIFDDDAGARISLSDVVVREGNAGSSPAVFQVTLTRPSSTEVSVDYVAASGTAALGSDFAASSGRLVFPPGSVTADVTVPVLGDTLPELDETFTVRLSNSSPPNATIAKAVGTGRIVNDDPFPELTVADVHVEEPDTGAAPAVLTFQLSFAIDRPVTVNYTTSDGTAQADDDYLAQSGIVTFPPGQTVQHLTLDIAGDKLAEGNEMFSVVLSNPTLATLGRTRATVTVLDQDPQPFLSVEDTTVAEGDSGLTNAVFTVRLSAPSAQTVTVSYSTSDDTARAGSDYQAKFGTVTFPPGSTNRTVAVAVLGNPLFEPDEWFQLRLSTPVNARLSSDQAFGTIRNDDPLPRLSVNDVAVTESPGGSVAQFTLRLSVPSLEAPVTVRYATADDGAQAGSDYASAAGLVTFGPGITQATIRVAILDDLAHEADETFFINLSDPVHAELLVHQGWGTIHDNDSPPAVYLRDTQVLEGDDGTASLLFAVELDRPSGAVVSASYATRDGTAAAATGDYLASAGQVRFEAGSTNTLLQVVVRGDVGVEPDETVLVELTDLVNGMPGRIRATGTILDDDTRRLTISDQAVSEGAFGTSTELVFTVTLNKPSSELVTVEYATRDGTASAGSDYTPAQGVLSFPPNTRSQTVSVTVLGDNVFEPDEVFFVNLSRATQAVISDPQGIGTIVNDDDALAIVPDAMTLDTEECTPANGAIDPDETVTVRLALVNIGTVPSSTVVARLLATPGITPFNAAQTYGNLPPNGDPVSRTFTFRAEGECGQTLQATLEIQNGGTNYGTATFPFLLGTNIAGQVVCCRSTDLSVSVSTEPAVVVGHELLYSIQVTNRGPRTATSVSLTNSWRGLVEVISASSSQGTCLIRGESVTCDWGTLEPGTGRTVQVTVAPQEVGPLIGVFYGKAAEHDPNPKNNTATIATIVTSPQGLSISSARVVENDTGTTNAIFLVRLFPSTGREVTVEFETADGTARASEDYVPTAGLVRIPAGETSASLVVPVLGDAILEADETFSVTLRNPVNTILAEEQTTGVATILDNDFPTLTVEDVSVVEPSAGTSTQAVLTLRLSAAPQRPVSVDFATADETARAPGDYAAAAGRLTFEAGAGLARISVEILSDPLAEPDEVFYVNLANAAGATLAAPRARVTITDNNPASLPQIFLRDAAVVEGPARGSTHAEFDLFLSRPSPQPVRVDYSTGNGSALGGLDFVIAAGTVTFAPPHTNATISVTVNGDDTPEPTETFLVRLSQPINGTLGVTQAVGTIINDDYLPALGPAGTQLLVENCQPFNGAIDPLETVTLNFGLFNRGLGPTTNLTASLRASVALMPLSNPQSYGALPANSAPAFRPFTFRLSGACGERHVVELELRDGERPVGTAAFELVTGVLANGEYLCCTSADLGVHGTASAEPATLLEPLVYTIVVTNHGPSVATGVIVTNRFNVPVEFLSETASGDCARQEEQLVCAVGRLDPGQSVTLTHVIAPTVLSPLVHFAVVAANEIDPVPANNVAVIASTVIPPTGLSISDAAVLEEDQAHTARILVRLWPPRPQPVSVEFDFQDGTAQAGLDYVRAPGTLVFPPGTTNLHLSVTVQGDTADEPDETFLVILRNPVNAALAQSTATCTIVDDDTPALSINNAAVNVGTNSAAVAVLSVSLSTPATEEVRVDYSTRNDTAAAGTDYEAQTGTLIFPPGTRSLPVRIPIAGNTADEGEERFHVTLANPQNATLLDPVGVVTITDEAPVDLSVSNASVVEGDTGEARAVFSVALRSRLQHTVSVEFFTSDGSAVAGADYRSASGTLVFEPGTLQQEVVVRVLGDLLAEPAETFLLNLTNALNGVIRNSRGVGTIIDDDPVPCLSLGDATVVEGHAGIKNALLPVTLSGPSSEVVSVEVVWPPCRSAAVPQNAGPELIVFTPGQTERTLTVSILGDTIDELDETCLFTLNNPLNATICRGQASLVVVDDDPAPGVEIADVTVREGNAGPVAATFTLILVGQTSQSVTLSYTTRDGSAQGGTDYQPISGSLILPPGVTATNLSVTVHGDATVEGDETFHLDLGPVTNASLFRGSATGTILNDDAPPQADCPSVVLLSTPGGQTCFQPFAPIALTALPNEAPDKIVRLEFYSGSTLLGVDTSAPFEIVWEGAPAGDYCLTAKAICQSGQSAESEPVCIGVTESGAAVAIIRNFPDPEIEQLREYLLEMGYCARVFDQEGLTFEELTFYQLVIWDDLGSVGLSDATVTILGQVFDTGIPLYLIGEQLLAAGGSLTPAGRNLWLKQLHLTPLGQSAPPGNITFSTATQDREPGSILSGRFAETTDFNYDRPVDLARGTADVTVLATASGADLFVQYPPSSEPDVGQARAVSQGFLAVEGGAGSREARKALFQNAACWLLRCSPCPFVHIFLLNSEVPEVVNVGDEFTFDVIVGNNGECIASGTIVTNQLPAGLGLVDATYNRGASIQYHPQTRTLVWRVGNVVSGFENNAILTVTVRALQPGLFTTRSCGVANYEVFSESNCTEFDVRIEGTGPVEPPTLELIRTAPGTFQLRLTAEQPGSYQIQTSSDLHTWLPWTNAPGPVYSIPLPDPMLPGSKARFYRTR